MNLENENRFINSTRRMEFVENVADYMIDSLKRLENMEEYIVDRIESEYAVCENRKTGKMENIKLIDLPKNIKEGAVIIFKDDKYYISEKEENDIKKRIEDKMNNLWK